MRKFLLVVVGAALLLGLTWLLWPKPEDLGRLRFFADGTYNFEATRVLNDVSVAGGDTGEAAQALLGVKAGNADSWYAAWKAAGDRTAALASRTSDPLAKGNALLRAHTYYRTAEFFLPPHDAKRPAVWKSNVDAFYSALDVLGVAHERITIPYGEHHLNAIYFPGPAGAAARPLLMVVGGYDSTMEELYLSIGAAALRRGYAVLLYEGPGQGSVIREQGLTFQPDWEKPNGAVLDSFLDKHARPAKIVLLGESMGGYLAPRAAAFDPRIDGVVAYDVFYDGYGIASRHVPPIAFWLREHNFNRILNSLSSAGGDPGATWAQQNGEWVFGVDDPFAVLEAFKVYRLAPVSALIKADVLIFAGADDHFVPSDQLEDFRKSLTNARSVTAVLFDRLSGGSEHCQMGAPSLWQGALFDWLGEKFPGAPALPAQG
jgi:alpha-beta hydrolase superfamily lysophospholipase